MSAVCQDGGEEEKVKVEGARESEEDRKVESPPSFNCCCRVKCVALCGVCMCVRACVHACVCVYLLHDCKYTCEFAHEYVCM